MSSDELKKITKMLKSQLERIAKSLEQLAPKVPIALDFSAAQAFIWQGASAELQPVHKVNRIPLDLLQGIDRQLTQLRTNTERFAKGYSANNALLWGARGMGKSSLVKAMHAEIAGKGNKLKLIEIHREELETLPQLMGFLRDDKSQFIVFCDDLSFDHDDTTYKSLKAALEGGIEGRPSNVLFYATSNRRHLLPRDMMENERSTAINPSEAVQEKVSLSDRFGLWLGFHNCNQDDYLAMVEAYAKHYGLKVKKGELKVRSLEWATTRGSRSGRVAWQFIQDLAGEFGVKIDG